MKISIRYGEKFYRAEVTPQWARTHDNGALISIGLTVGEDLSRLAFSHLRAAHRLTEVSALEFNHSGCQSSCTLRGDAKCSW
jgi:hypothetical protein